MDRKDSSLNEFFLIMSFNGFLIKSHTQIAL